MKIKTKVRAGRDCGDGRPPPGGTKIPIYV